MPACPECFRHLASIRVFHANEHDSHRFIRLEEYSWAKKKRLAALLPTGRKPFGVLCQFGRVLDTLRQRFE